MRCSTRPPSAPLAEATVFGAISLSRRKTSEQAIHLFLRRNRSRRSPARLVAYNDIHLVVHSIQAPNQTIDRELSNAAGDERRNVRLLEAEHGGSLGLGKLPAFYNSTNLANELGLEKLFLRIVKTEVGKNI